MAIIIYGDPLSPFVRKTQIVLAEKGVEYTLESANPFDPPDWFREISPAKRIPVMRDTDVGKEGVPGTIPDSSAICLYLERKFPEPALYPEDPFEYGRALWYEEYADSELALKVGMNLFRPIFFPRMTGGEPDLEAARKGWNEKLPPLFDYLEGALDGREFFVGNSFSIADISVAAQLVNAQLVAGPPDAGRWPGLVAHLERTTQRPSAAANLAVCKKIIKEPVKL